MSRIENAELAVQALVFRKWHHEWDDRLKAHIERIARETGCSWWDVVMEDPELFLGEEDE